MPEVVAPRLQSTGGAQARQLHAAQRGSISIRRLKVQPYSPEALTNGRRSTWLGGLYLNWSVAKERALAVLHRAGQSTRPLNHNPELPLVCGTTTTGRCTGADLVGSPSCVGWLTSFEEAELCWWRVDQRPGELRKPLNCAGAVCRCRLNDIAYRAYNLRIIVFVW
jgi:hypothetical protein